MQATNEQAVGFSFVRGGLFYRLQRRIGLIPDDGLGVGRRILALAAITWLPAVILAASEGRVVGGAGEPLLRHFGVHARCLVSIPAFVSLGGWWYLAVGRPVFVTLLLLWLWRLVVALRLFRGIANLDLKLAPTHPDGAAGLGFLQLIPMGFAPVVFGISVAVAARFAHDMVYHGVHITELRLPVIALLIALLALFLAPLGAFSGKLRRLKRESLWRYGSLIGKHGRLVHRR